MKSHLGFYAALNQQVSKLNEAQTISCANVPPKYRQGSSHHSPLRVVAVLFYLDYNKVNNFTRFWLSMQMFVVLMVCFLIKLYFVSHVV